MKAMRLRQPGGLDKLELDHALDSRPPGPGELRVRLHASSLNYHDYVLVSGGIPTVDGRIPMTDGAGTVLDVGPRVSGWAPGDRVMSLFFPDWLGGRATPENTRTLPGDRDDGFAREEVTAPASWFTRVPAGYSHAEAATLPCAGLTAWRALMVDGPLLAGETVLVQGSGGVSVFALQFAKAAGATVIATTSSRTKMERYRALGADHVIDHRADPEWGRTVRKLTGGRGVDHVVEVGGAANVEQSIHACAMGGHIAVLGVLAGHKAPLSTVRVMSAQLRLQGLTVGSREQQLAMVRAIEATGLRPVLDRSFALAELADAFEHQLSGAHFGKIVLRLSED
jgi:NADPH:quinone reductase-like Zn-dependent oxidoreductase